MDRRPCMCLQMLMHLLPFASVAGSACCRAGGPTKAGGVADGNEACRVGSTEVGRVGSTEVERVDSTEVGRVGSTEAVCC